MLKIKTIIFLITSIFFNIAQAGDVYAPSISVSDYENALSNNGKVNFEITAVPSELKGLALKNFSDDITVNENGDQFISPTIINGSNASRGEYPEYTAMLVENGGQLFLICGATLISSRKVLTAAHCSTNPTTHYFIPDFYTFSDYQNGISPSQIFRASSKKIHPNFNSSTLDYDVAVFTLIASASTKKAVLYDESNSLAGNSATAIGMGLLNPVTEARPNILQKVNVPIVSNSACQNSWGAITPITSRMICAGFLSTNRGTCNGDSGGSLWSTVNGKRVLVGIPSFVLVSNGVGCSAGAYNGYARISSLSNFIKQQAPSASYSSQPKSVTLAPIYNLLN